MLEDFNSGSMLFAVEPLMAPSACGIVSLQHLISVSFCSSFFLMANLSQSTNAFVVVTILSSFSQDGSVA